MDRRVSDSFEMLLKAYGSCSINYHCVPTLQAFFVSATDNKVNLRHKTLKRSTS